LVMDATSKSVSRKTGSVRGPAGAPRRRRETRRYRPPQPAAPTPERYRRRLRPYKGCGRARIGASSRRPLDYTRG
jgi:hypothetical protein